MDQVMEKVKSYSYAGLNACKDNPGQVLIGMGLGAFISGIAGWGVAAAIAFSIIVVGFGCAIVFDKARE